MTTGTETKLSLRSDPELERALTVLMAAGAANRTAAARTAILDAARATERAARERQLRAEAERIRNDPADRAEIAAVRAFFDDDYDSWTTE